MPQREPLWTARAMARATGGRWLTKPRRDWAPTSISYNLLTPRAKGHVIVCMTPKSWARSRPDTSKKLARWAEGGAVAAVIQSEQLKGLPRLPRDFPLLLVRDTRQALSRLAAAGRDRFEGTVIALTGTVGKTTTREMLRHVLAAQGGATASAGNNNNIPGVERTIASTPHDHAYCICEMGFGHPRGGISVSSSRLRPHVALITRVSPAHLDVFAETEFATARGVELVADQKAGIFDGLEPDGAVVLGHDHDQYARLRTAAERKGASVVSYGETAEADARLVECRLGPDGSAVRLEIMGEPVELSLPLIGHHMALNALGALTTVKVAGGDVASAAQHLADFRPVQGRARVETIELPGGTATLIDDSYNATPDSVRSTLDLLGVVAPTGARRVAVLGDILHLGPRSSRLHAGLADAIAEAGVDRVLTTGEMMKRLHAALPESVRGPHCVDHSELYARLRAELEPGDVLTIKASTPLKLGVLAHALRKGKTSI